MEKGDSVLYLDEAVQYPCLLIYFPSAEDVCASCIDYAFNSVSKNFGDFMNSRNIAIVTNSYFPNLNPRVVKKDILRMEDEYGLVSLDNSNPIYLLLNNERRVISCYVPNVKWNNETVGYLDSVKRYLGFSK